MEKSYKDKINELEKAGYMVLKGIETDVDPHKEKQVGENVGIFIDVETTGLEHEKDEIIQLSMVKFIYNQQGEITRIQAKFDQLNEPKNNGIPNRITYLTGITDEMVEGKVIDPELVRSFTAEANVIVAHNADFDRRFVEKFFPFFQHHNWACSMSQINWEWAGSSKLEFLMFKMGYFYRAHNAINDCFAGIELLKSIDLEIGQPFMNEMLKNAREVQYRLWALKSPFEKKDILSDRGYNAQYINGKFFGWYIDVEAENGVSKEADFLIENIYDYNVTLQLAPVGPKNRFTDRFSTQNVSLYNLSETMGGYFNR